VSKMHAARSCRAAWVAATAVRAGAALGLVVAALSPAVSRAADIPRGRLPATVVPEAYKLDLEIDPAADRFRGHVEISIRNDTPLRTFYLNGKGLHVTSAAVRTRGTVTPAHYAEVDPIGVAEISLKGILAAGRHLLVIDYDGALDDGIFHAKVGAD
jgi:hypothetical protein